MKTAMTELITHLEMHKSRVDMVDINSLIDYANSSLEKEKEQIIKAVEDTRDNIVPKMFIGENLSGQEYYNQTYNQNK